MKIIKVVPGDAGSYRCEVTAKDKCDSSTFDISVEGECEKKKLKPGSPWQRTSGILCTVWISMCCFFRYSRTTRGAGWYSVYFQEGVSAAEGVWSVEIKRPGHNAKCKKMFMLSFCVTGIVCKLVRHVQKACMSLNGFIIPWNKLILWIDLFIANPIIIGAPIWTLAWS